MFHIAISNELATGTPYGLRTRYWLKHQNEPHWNLVMALVNPLASSLPRRLWMTSSGGSSKWPSFAQFRVIRLRLGRHFVLLRINWSPFLRKFSIYLIRWIRELKLILPSACHLFLNVVFKLRSCFFPKLSTFDRDFKDLPNPWGLSATNWDVIEAEWRR